SPRPSPRRRSQSAAGGAAAAAAATARPRTSRSSKKPALQRSARCGHRDANVSPAVTEIRRVEGRRDFRRFIDYTYARNAADSHWVPPLRLSEHERLTAKKNPFFEHADVELLLALRSDRVVGRIAAIDDRLHNQTHG